MPLFIFLIIDNNKKSKMKKITKTNFQGLRQLFPVLGKEDMRHYVGGYSNGYWNGNWNNPYSYFDYGGYTGYNGYYYDGSGYRLPEVTVYGYYPNHNQGGGDFWPIFPNGPLENPNAGYSYSSGQQGYNGNPGINGNSGYGYYGYYGYYDTGYYGGGSGGNVSSDDDGNPNLIHLNDGECVVAAIANAGIMLGVDLSVSSITSDLKKYKDNKINRYVISDELLGNILDDYFDVTIASEVSEITKPVVLGKPVCVRLIIQQNTVDGIEYQQLHDVVITGVNNSMNGYFEYYDSVTGEIGHLTKSELETKTTRKFYILDHK